MKLENLKLNLETELVLNVGDPIGKTNAPRCYNKLFERMDMNAIMLPCEIKKGQLPQFIDACHLMGFIICVPPCPTRGILWIFWMMWMRPPGCSVPSMPSALTRREARTGMDGKGAIKAMVNGGAKLDGINALVYGAGGISGVVTYELSRQNVKKLYIANITPEEPEQIAKVLRENTAMVWRFSSGPAGR